MRHQPSPEAPPQFDVTLTNEGPETVIVHVGAGLLWWAGAEYPSEVVILPIDYHPPGFPTTPTNGCWAFTAESRPPVPAIAQFGPLGNGDRLATTFAVYSDPAIEPCYPPGEHLIRDAVGLGENGLDRRELTVTLAVDESGTFSVEAGPREIWT